MAKMIADFIEKEHVTGQFMVNSVQKGTNEYGPYLTISLKDASGVIDARKWGSTLEDEEIFVQSNVVYVEGDVVQRPASLQLKITKAQKVDIEDVDLAKFIKHPPIPKEELIKRFTAHVESIKNEDCRKILDYFINKFGKSLYEFPAAVSVHHDYGSGLLMHTVSMADLGVILAERYPPVDKDILLTGILLHDMGKTIEFEGPVIYKYSLEGRLIGHISIMVGEIRIAAKELKLTSEVPLLLEHMVLSHHGSTEFGSPILPMTKEALLLSLIDNLDSKMVIVEKALDGVKPGEFSQKVYPLDNRSFYKPKEK